MRFLKGAFVFIAVVMAIVTIVLLVRNWIEVDRLWAVATSQKSNNMYQNPRNWIMFSAIAAFVSGAFAGLAIAWPRHTFKQKLAEQQLKDAAVLNPETK